MILSAAVLTFTHCSKSVDEIGGCQFEPMEKYTMVWNDEFDGTELDESKWSYQLGNGCNISQALCGWGNAELQNYTQEAKNIKVEDGILIITATEEDSLDMDGNPIYHSARIRTVGKGDWKYGRIDVRAKMPIGQGIWPAIWMLSSENVYGPWPTSGEIDIMEYLGNDPRRVLGTIHYGHDFWRYKTQEINKEDSLPSFHDEFHIFSVLWNERCIQFMVDDVPFGEPNTPSTTLPTTYPFDQKFYLLLNLAVGGNLPGAPDASTEFPQKFEVDYVRVYQTQP